MTTSGPCSVTDELERSARRSPTPTARGLALRCRGLLNDDPDVLLEAVAAHRTGPRPYQLAAACEDAGIALGHTARADEAVALLNEAVAGYERLEAVRDVARVQSAQRTLGIPRSRRSPRRPSFGWDSLTPTELQVVSLVAEGLTNRQIAERLFVSRRTVATHLEHVFQKLGHANRVELAADVARRGHQRSHDANSSDSTRSSPSQPTNASSGSPGQADPPSGRIDRIQQDRDHHNPIVSARSRSRIGHLTDVGNFAPEASLGTAISVT